MIASVLTTLFFALSIIFAARSARHLGTSRANLARMVVALIFLGAWAFLFGQGLRGQSLPWYLWSGAVGFGMGDMAMFIALTRIGPALTVLLIQCLAAPMGALIEWAWLGTRLTPAQMISSAVILTGVAVAVAPGGSFHPQPRELRIGICAGIIASLGQALGAVFSRKAAVVATATGLPIDGWTSRFSADRRGPSFYGGLLFCLEENPTDSAGGEKARLAARIAPDAFEWPVWTGHRRRLLPVGAGDQAERTGAADRGRHAGRDHAAGFPGRWSKAHPPRYPGGTDCRCRNDCASASGVGEGSEISFKRGSTLWRGRFCGRLRN
ncbi:MAG: DMT family transporter [Chthoniobacteraceae bacterium]